MKKFIVIANLISFLFISAAAQDSFKLLCDSAQSQINNGNYKEALELYDKAFEILPTDSATVVWNASIGSMCALELNNEQKAIQYNNIAIEYGSTDESLIEQQLELAKKHNDLETTEKVLLQIKDTPGIGNKYTVKLLYFYFNNKKHTQTIKIADEVLAFEPGNTNARYFKSIALLKTSHENEAIELLTGILAEDPENHKANRELGLIYYNKASVIFDSANKKYKSIKAPTRLDYHNYRQEIKKAEPDYKNALPYLEKSNAVVSKDYIFQAITITKNRLRQLTQDDK